MPLLLCLALLCAQGLGLVHRIGHAPRAQTLQVTPGHAVEAVAPMHGAAGWRALADALTGHEHGAPECRLYDQASAADVLVLAPSPAGADAPAHAMPRIGEQATPVAGVAHALPRGPPRA